MPALPRDAISTNGESSTRISEPKPFNEALPPQGFVRRRVVQFPPETFLTPGTVRPPITQLDAGPATAEDVANLDRSDLNDQSDIASQKAATVSAPATPTLEELQLRSRPALAADAAPPTTPEQTAGDITTVVPDTTVSTLAATDQATTVSTGMAYACTEHVPSQKILLLCAGTVRRPRGLSALLGKYGCEVVAFDKVDGASGDITDDAIWLPLADRINSGHFNGVFASPPCSTFSRARALPGGGADPTRQQRWRQVRLIHQHTAE